MFYLGWLYFYGRLFVNHLRERYRAGRDSCAVRYGELIPVKGRSTADVVAEVIRWIDKHENLTEVEIRNSGRELRTRLTV